MPQGLSYARLAGLPPVYGLYGAFVPVLVYAGLGSSRELAVGPVAVTSLLIGTSLPPVVARAVPGFRAEPDPGNPVNPAGQAAYNRAAIQVAALAGAMYTAVGFLHMGWIVDFLSHSVIAGFMTGTAVTVGVTQLRSTFGYDSRPLPGAPPIKYEPFPRATRTQVDDRVFAQLTALFSKGWLPYFKWRDFVMTMSWLALLFAFKWVGSRSRRLVWLKAIGPLTVMILSTAITAGAHLGCDPKAKAFNPKCVRVVGVVPKGLPHQTVTWWAPMPALAA